VRGPWGSWTSVSGHEVQESIRYVDYAADLGVFQQNVNRYLKGARPHVDFLIVVAIKERVSLNWLMLGRGRRDAA